MSRRAHCRPTLFVPWSINSGTMRLARGDRTETFNIVIILCYHGRSVKSGPALTPIRKEKVPIFLGHHNDRGIIYKHQFLLLGSSHVVKENLPLAIFLLMQPGNGNRDRLLSRFVPVPSRALGCRSQRPLGGAVPKKKYVS